MKKTEKEGTVRPQGPEAAVKGALPSVSSFIPACGCKFYVHINSLKGPTGTFWLKLGGNLV